MQFIAALGPMTITNNFKNASYVRFTLCIVIITLLLLSFGGRHGASASKSQDPQYSGFQLQHLDLTFNNNDWSGNPYDLVATVTFEHSHSDRSRTTEMFYAGGNLWKARFTADEPGTWTYTTSSSDSDLNGQSGSIEIQPSNSLGFVETNGNKWVRSKTGEAFVPQFVMGANPNYFNVDESKAAADVATFIDGHGFNGIHIKVGCRWFDINAYECGEINSSSPNPDERTFEALEQVIEETYAAGGVVHIWVWGDEDRDQTPARWGYNGSVDRRLQRHIAARLGPMPGWTMGYGFDLFEWTTESQLESWHSYMHDHMGWPHLLGARSTKNELDQIYEQMDFSSYEQHRPNYSTYVQTLNARPHKPSLSADRFRVRDGTAIKDYSLDDTRHGLWRSGMAGGVANIWGYLLDGGTDDSGSAPYPNQQQIKLYSDFFGERFHASLYPCNELTSGQCLKNSANNLYIFYHENTNSIQVNLSQMGASQAYIAVDTKSGNRVLGSFQPVNGNWAAPYYSDWAISVGNFCAINPGLPQEDCVIASTPTPSPTSTSTPTTVPTNTPTPTVTPTQTPIPPTATHTPTQTSTPVPPLVVTPDDFEPDILWFYFPFAPG